MYIDRYALLKYGPDLTDDWFHIMLVHNSLAADPYSATSIYYDGVFFGYTRTWSSNSQGIQYLGRNSSNNSFAKAKIDEVSLFDEQKDPSDVRSEDGKPLDLTNLNPFGWWRMGDAVNGSGGSVPNQGIGIGWPGVSNHIDATLYNTPTFTTDTPG